MTDLADEIGKTYGGWFDVAQQACVVKGRWKALMIGQAPAAWNYRTDMFRAAGVEKFPDTFDELLVAARKLHAKGTPIGMTLGHAPGDGRSTNYPVLWAFGGKEFEADGKTVALNSPQTLKAVEWYTEMYKDMDPGVTAWLDPDNNQAFLAGKVSATVNVNTIYLAARAAAPDRTRQEDADRQHGPRQLAGGAGRAVRALQHQPVGGLRLQQEPRGPAGLPAGLVRPELPPEVDQDRAVLLHPAVRRLREGGRLARRSRSSRSSAS